MPDGRRNNRGTKGNKGGRPPKADEAKIRDLVSPYIPGAVQTLAELMATAKRPADRISAAVKLLEYGFGKPRQMVDVTSGGNEITGPPVYQIVVPQDAQCLNNGNEEE